jgi:hypothetical protein
MIADSETLQASPSSFKTWVSCSLGLQIHPHDFLKTHYFGYGCREIAQIMECPVDTVKTRMFYARRKLKASLASRREAI